MSPIEIFYFFFQWLLYIKFEWFLQELEMACVFANIISIYIVCVNLHSMIKLMLTFVNSGLRKTMIIMMLNIMPKNPKVGTNTPLTTRSNHSVEGDSLSFSIFFSISL